MIDKNAAIEQVIYTGGGNGRFHHGGSDFGVWGQSRGFDWRKNRYEFSEILSLMKVGHKVVEKDGKVISDNYARETRRGQRLKADAKPLGFFKRQYKENDYESYDYTVRNEIKVLEESIAVGLTRTTEDDFRENPEDADYRIAYTKLVDGRLFVARLSGINAFYSDLESRVGNFFAQAFIFPVGTKIEDIDLKSLDWQYGLEDKYWKGEGMKAPEYLETTSINKMISNIQQRKQTETSTQSKSDSIDRKLSESELLQLYKQAQSEKDPIGKRDLKKIFRKHIDSGSNLIEIRKLAYMELLNAKKLNMDTIDYEFIVGELDLEGCKFDELFGDFCSLSSDTSMTYQQQKQTSERLKSRLSKCDMSVVTQFAQSQKELFEVMREYERLSNPNKKESDYTKNGVDASYRFFTYCQSVMQKQEGMQQ